MTRSITLALAVFMSLAWLSPAALASITVTGNRTRVSVRDNGPHVNYDFNETSIPSSASLDVSLSNQLYGRAEVDFSTFGGQTILSMAMDLRRVGVQDEFARAILDVRFTAGESTSYVATGNYSVDDPDGSSGMVYFHSILYDVTDGVFMYESRQQSRSTNDESFVLGGLGGDYSNVLVGSLIGTLTKGHEYQFYTRAYTDASPNADSGAKASGNFTLTIGEVGVVPEPLSMVVWSGLGLVAGCFGWRKRRAPAS